MRSILTVFLAGIDGYYINRKSSSASESLLDNRGKGIGLRLGVKTSGCSGLAYVLEFVDVLNSEDQVLSCTVLILLSIQKFRLSQWH